ncbi:MAG: 30S ribosome-binding factor RbfA [Myxococcota bacterium]|nr:30S ribosome-binding factor RbfA [Myxococcota bacterium]
MATRGDNRRIVRVGEAIREALAHLLVKETNDPLLAWATITDVNVSADLRHARVYFAATGADDMAAVERHLTRAAPFFQRELGARLNLRYTPRLVFLRDVSFDQGERVDRLIQEIEEDKIKMNENMSLPRRFDGLVHQAERILVATHRNPDGDAIGSLLGMSHMLKLMGKDHVAYCPDGIPKVLSFLPGSDSIATELTATDAFDLTILLDTADGTLLPDGFPEAEARGTWVVIDHHMAYKEMGDVIIRKNASAVGEILFNLCEELVWPIDAHVATCLYASIVSDTGSFRYSSTSSAALRTAAKLLDAGAKPWIIASQLFESYSIARQRLLAEVLQTLEVSKGGRYAQMHATSQMFEKTGASKEDLDGLINFGRAIDGVEIAAMFRVKASDGIKVSFRSKGRIDVSHLAARFDGGGHRNAAGCTLKGLSLEQARETVKREAEALLASNGASK